MKTFHEWLKDENLEEGLADYTPSFIRKPLQNIGLMGKTTDEKQEERKKEELERRKEKKEKEAVLQKRRVRAAREKGRYYDMIKTWQRQP